MPSPFPGMDPYLEAPGIWSDFHGTFLMRIRAGLNEQLPHHYVARWDRYVWIDEPDLGPPLPLGRPDVFVTDAFDREESSAAKGTLTAPVTGTVPIIDPMGKPYLKIIDVRGRRVVTVIELLSPANKTPGKDRDAYLAKRADYIRTKTNLVEMDFLRSGQRPPVEGNIPPSDYRIVVCRAGEYPRAGIWPLGVRDPLPPLPVPLSAEDEPLRLELRPCLDQAYEEGRFGEEIDYDQPPVPPLSDSDAAWASERLAGRSP